MCCRAKASASSIRRASTRGYRVHVRSTNTVRLPAIPLPPLLPAYAGFLVRFPVTWDDAVASGDKPTECHTSQAACSCHAPGATSVLCGVVTFTGRMNRNPTYPPLLLAPSQSPGQEHSGFDGHPVRALFTLAHHDLLVMHFPITGSSHQNKVKVVQPYCFDGRYLSSMLYYTPDCLKDYRFIGLPSRC